MQVKRINMKNRPKNCMLSVLQCILPFFILQGVTLLIFKKFIAELFAVSLRTECKSFMSVLCQSKEERKL